MSSLALLSSDLRVVVGELGFTALTPIQERSIPLLLAGRDVMAQSQTGSGKTLAYTLPLLDLLNPRLRRPQALVLCPTRELASQVTRVVRTLGRRIAGLQVVTVGGGQPFRPQAQALENGAHVVVGTPGRVRDHLQRGTLHLDCLKTVVLDEADRMLDAGFAAEVREILAACPTARQTALFSATLPPAITEISRAYQRQPSRITIGTAPGADGDDRAKAAPNAIRQLLVETASEDKVTTLLALLDELRPSSSVIFCNLKVAATELAAILTQRGIDAAALHGDLEQRDRDRVMAKFRNGSARALVATDVAARGIDLESIGVVFNFDLPSRPEVYLHRIGRTGRAGSAGLAVSLATPREAHKIAAIEAFTAGSLERKSAHRALPPLTHAATHKAPMVTLRVGGGRKDKVRPGDILGALTGEACGLPADAVGKIEIHDRFAYVAVARQVAAAARRGLAEGRIKGRRLSVELDA